MRIARRRIGGADAEVSSRLDNRRVDRLTAIAERGQQQQRARAATADHKPHRSGRYPGCRKLLHSPRAEWSAVTKSVTADFKAGYGAPSLADTEARENPAEKIVRREFADDLAQRLLSHAQLLGHELACTPLAK